MLRRIELSNFRKHERFSLSCKDRNVLVGPNNAGKSSILDALRLFADVQRAASRRVPILKSYSELGVCASYDFSNTAFSVTLENICRNYSKEYATVCVHNDSGSKLHIRINPDLPPEVFIETEKKISKNKGFFSTCFPERVIVVPTLGQFEESEKPNDPSYVRSIEFTRLAARNFRNIWRNKEKVDFLQFSELVKTGWPNINISPPELDGSFPPSIQMFFKEDGIDREIYWSGFGFQAWLQMMTHFLRGGENDVLVLDEPDVYLHADLQRRLFHTSKKRFSQIFIATHSSEIMNEANANDVILIKPGSVQGARITSETGYRNAHTLLGSSENADFARLARAKRVIAFEGDDRSIFKRFEQRIMKSGILSDPDTLSVKIGGFEHWQRVQNLSWTFRELFGLDAKIVAIFDRDYRCDEEISEFEKKLGDAGVLCHVLKRKEIENYLLDEGPLTQAIVRASRKRSVEIAEELIHQKLAELSERIRDDELISCQSAASKYYSLRRDPRDTSTILREAKNEFDRDWLNFGFKKRLGGKVLLADIKRYFQSEFSISLTNPVLTEEFSRETLDGEIVELVEKINNSMS